MVRIPYSPYSTQQDAPFPTPMQTPNSELLGAAKNFGRAVGEASNVIAEEALREKRISNEADAKTLDVDAMVKLGEVTTRYNSLEGKNAVDAYPQYVADVKRVREETLGGIQNPEVRRMVDGVLTTRVGYAVMDGARHSAGQNKVYLDQANKARIDANVAGAYGMADDKQFEDTLGSLKSDALQRAQVAGASPEVAEEEVRKATGNAWIARLQGIALADPKEAKSIYDANRERIDPKSRISIEQFLSQRMQVVGAKQSAESIISRAASPTKLTLDGAPDMKNLSPGASALVQGLVAAGVVPELKIKSGFRDPARNDAAGGAKDSEHTRGNAIDVDVSGMTDAQKAAVLEQAIANGARGIGIYPGGKSLHLDTRAAPATWGPSAEGSYKGVDPSQQPAWAQPALKMLFSGALPERKALPPVREGMLPQLLNQAAVTAEQEYPGNVEYKQRLEDQVRSNYNVQMAQLRDTQYVNRQTVIGFVLGDGTGTPVTDMSQIENNPVANKAFMELDPSVRKTIQAQVARNANAVPMDDTRVARMQELLGEAKTDPVAFLQRNVLEEDLPQARKLELARLQAQTQAQLKKGGDQDPQLNSALSLLRTTGVLKAAGIDNPKGTQYKQFAGAMAQAMQTFIADKKKQPNDDEVRKMAAKLLTGVPGTGWFGSSVGQVPLYRSEPDAGYTAAAETVGAKGATPKAAFDKIQAEWRRKYPNAATLTLEQVNEIYAQNKGKF